MTKEEKVIEYLNGEMDQNSKSIFENELKNDPQLHQLFKEYEFLFSTLNDASIAHPSKQLKQNVQHLINQESVLINSKTKNHIRNIIALILLGTALLFIGYKFLTKSNSATEYKQLPEVKSNLYEQSITGRIHAVKSSVEPTKNSQVVSTLIKVLNEDPSSNVRLATVKVLDQYITNENARIALVNALAKEKDPFVLIEIINSLAKNKEKSAIHALEKLTKEIDLEKFIKDEAHLGLFQIQEI